MIMPVSLVVVIVVVRSFVVVVKQSATPGWLLGTHVALFDSSSTYSGGVHVDSWTWLEPGKII